MEEQTNPFLIAVFFLRFTWVNVSLEILIHVVEYSFIDIYDNERYTFEVFFLLYYKKFTDALSDPNQ